jgi:hypothetical protein
MLDFAFYIGRLKDLLFAADTMLANHIFANLGWWWSY